MTENQMTVSVIIPALNESKTIGHLLQALQNQTVPPFEVIVVDNGSDDNTGEVASEYGALVVREERRGTNNALESGRFIARGELIARIDADCIPDPTWVARASKYFQNPKAVGVTGPYDYYDATPGFRKFTLFYQKYIYSVSHRFLDITNIGAVMIGGNSMMRASTLKQIGGFDRSIRFYGDDTDLAKKLSRLGTVIFDKNLLMKSSARRFKREGVLSILWKYFYGFLKLTFRS